jgi:dihydrofolate synthase / folylpolyglutamate synthase
MATVKQTSSKGSVALGKLRSYNEVIEFLEKNWQVVPDGKSVERMKKLDKFFSNPSTKLKTVLISGTNGKSLTAHFATKLFQREGLSVGTFFSPHLVTYNERFAINGEIIGNKAFTDIANEVINASEIEKIKATSYEVLTQIALNYFVEQNVHAALFESSYGGSIDATAICSPVISAITRLTGPDSDESGKVSEKVLKDYLSNLKKGTHLISADQNKANLKAMAVLTEKIGAHWAMPIRKLVALNYPFEQLQGRCAALAERIASIFINDFIDDKKVSSETLLKRQKGQRGRPTLEAKKELELNPKNTIEQFWKETVNDLPGKFHILDKEKPTILIDNAHNADAFDNLLLGIRLLHYQRPIKHLTLLIGCEEDAVDADAFAKQIRYFFKKTPGNITLCSLKKTSGWHKPSWNVEKINATLKNIKVKSRIASTFKEAFETAKKATTDRNGLIVIAGSSAFLQEYWSYKGLKKA